ncbi:MAG: hypothetical protein V8S27_02715 [Lachnospiraceae bacterium]
MRSILSPRVVGAFCERWLADYVLHKKKYFSAPSTDLGIYYVYHSMDSEYEKVKTTKPESLLEAMCKYVGYASGCYEGRCANGGAVECLPGASGNSGDSGLLCK